MKSFQLLAASAAIAAVSQAAAGVWTDCTDFEADGYGSEATCLLNEMVAKVIVETESIAYDSVAATNAEGYNLNLFRLISRLDGTAPTNVAQLGPIVLVHGEDGCAGSWFTQDVDLDSTPTKLFELGYDVWLTNRRGSPASRTFDETVLGGDPRDPDDAANGAAEFWDWSQDEVGKEDLTTFISKVIEQRNTDGLPCRKPQLVTFGTGGQEALIMMGAFPEDSAAYVDRVVTQATCIVKNVGFGGFTEPAGTDDRRMLSTNNSHIKEDSRQLSHYPTCSKSSYYATMRYWKGELTYEQYHEFYHLFYSWRMTQSYDWYCGEEWKDEIRKALCAVSDEDFCIPADYKFTADLFQAFQDNEIYSVFGPNWDTTDVDDICLSFDDGENNLGEDDPICVYLRGLTPGPEASIKYAYQCAQQSFSKMFSQFNDDWATNGWKEDTETPKYDVTGITVPMLNQYIDGDTLCDVEAHRKIQSMVQSEQSQFFWFGDEDHTNYKQSGNVDIFDQLVASLNQTEDADADLDCAVAAEWTA